MLPLWAVHIPDGVLTWPWWTGGLAIAAMLALVGAWRIRDEEIPQVALLTSAFFGASLVHVKVGPSSVHLLLNGLVGVVLGWRAALAIPIGLFLQAVLFGHGGLSTLGVNSCVMALAALLAWWLFALLRRLPWAPRPWFRMGLVVASVWLWVLVLIYGLALLVTTRLGQLSMAFHAGALGAAFILAVPAAWAEHRLENSPEFPLGLLAGQIAVLATVVLHCLVLMAGGQRQPDGPQLQALAERLGVQASESRELSPQGQDGSEDSGREAWRTFALVTLLLHLPIAVVEGIILGFTVGFLARVKPEMLGWIAPQRGAACSIEPLP